MGLRELLSVQIRSEFLWKFTFSEFELFQKAVPNGSRGVEDYSKWNFTFDPTYHEIVNGTNLINSESHVSKFFLIMLRLTP